VADKQLFVALPKRNAALLLLVLLLLSLPLMLQRASNGSSPDLLAKFALAANANQAAARSPMWFGSAAVHDELGEAAEQAAGEATTAAF
jgi:hypothetical protein